MKIIYTILGVPKEDLEYLTNQNATRTNGSATASAAQNANQYGSPHIPHSRKLTIARELLRYLGSLVDARTAEPKDDLISKLVLEQVNKGTLEKADAVQIAFLVLVAGNATMISMINLGVIELLRNPKQKEELIANPGLAPKFVEELCRFHTASAMAMKRVAKEDIELGGQVLHPPSIPLCYIHALTKREQHIKAGEGIIASNQSGNRDEDVFPNPDVFDMHREFKKDGLGFGFGPHRCIAETLSKTELIAVFSKFPPHISGRKKALGFFGHPTVVPQN
ncbi:cytochrome P450 [Candidatus Bathyarchaeota archaeon]|nr:cytochrome P450 [Candidatus Bathyarchaeota archaeon]